MYKRQAYINVTFHREGIKQSVRPDGGIDWHVVRRRPGTVGISAAIQKKYGVEVVPHLICGGQSKYDLSLIHICVLLDVVRYALEHGVADPLGERSRAPCVGGLRLGFGRGAPVSYTHLAGRRV